MNDVTTPGAADALDALISQFSSPLDCLRELVQNSIDAGSPRIDVWLSYEPAADGGGTMLVHVDDIGEGMDEAIIDQQLTTLYASSKAGDLTKIGKFGIGFVSVFALAPRAVLVQTGRGGEYWEVFFGEDRSFTKSRLEEPVEGTRVTLFLAGDAARYATLVASSRATLHRWCRHSDTEITFADRSDPRARTPALINEPFTLEAALGVRVELDGTEILLGYRRAPEYAFFNKGLTLFATREAELALGAHAERFAHIGFKLKSRYLEHTLSRETILKDQNYDKAIALLRSAADQRLATALVEELVTLAARPAVDLPAQQRWAELCAYLADEPDAVLLAARSRPVVRTTNGPAISLAELERCGRGAGRLFIAGERSPMTDRLAADGVAVVYDLRAAGAIDSSPVRKLLIRYLVAQHQRSFAGRLEQVVPLNLRARVGRPGEWRNRDRRAFYAAQLVEVEQDWLTIEPLTEAGPATRLVAAAAGLLARVQAPVRELRACRLVEATGSAPLFLVGDGRTARPLVAGGAVSRGPVVVNCTHPHVAALSRLHQQRPALATYVLAKNVLLHVDRGLELDLALIRAAVEA